MRISTNQIYDAGALNIQRSQSASIKTYNQISSGRRILTPADDPVAAAQALVVTQSQAVMEQYVTNQKNATSQLAIVDSQLSSLTDLLQSVRDSVVRAGNSALSSSDRKSIASELEASLSQMMGIANSDNGSGDYLFSGYQGGTVPFVVDDSQPVVPPATTSPVAYYGDSGERLLQVSSSRQMAVSVSGSDVFMNGSSSNQSLFQTMQNLIGILKTPIDGATYTSAQYFSDLSVQQKNVDLAMENISQVQTDVGTRMRELESLGTASSDLAIQYSATLSDLQDLDYNKALTDYSKQQVNLEAARKAFVQISGLSLFKYL